VLWRLFMFGGYPMGILLLALVFIGSYLSKRRAKKAEESE